MVLENSPDDAELAKRFLLGDVSDAERARIEDRFLASDDFHQELLLAEDDLIDAYVRDELPAGERALFARSYLNSRARSERLEFARRLSHTVSGKPLAAAAAAVAATVADTAADTAPGRAHARTISPWHSLVGRVFVRRPALGFTLAAALLFVVLGGLWLLSETAPTRTAPETAQTIPPAQPAASSPPAPSPPPPAAAPAPSLSPAAPAPSPRESMSPQIAWAEKSPSNPEKKAPRAASRETPVKRTPFVVALTLLPGLARGGSGAQLILPDAATEVRLRLGMDGETYKKYRATLSTPEGRKIWSRVVTRKPATQSGRLTLSLPAKLLQRGDYVLEIGGANSGDGEWESVADYAFRVLRK